MAIETVNSANLAEYVAARVTKGTEISNGEQLTAAAVKAAPKAAEKPTETKTDDGVTITTGAETSSQAPPEPQGDGEHKKGEKKDVQSRINELTRLRKEAEEFAEDEYNARLRAERRIGELESQLKTPQAEHPKAPEDLKRPSPKDFTTQEAYDAALDDYDRKRDERIAAKVAAEERARIAMERQNEAMQARVNSAKAELDDFDEVIAQADRNAPAVPPHVQAAIYESDYGPHIAYHLAKNPDEQKRIFSLPVAKALLELGKIETRYQKAEAAAPAAPKPQPTIETTRAPAPVSSIRGESGTVQTDLASPMPFEQYKKLRMEQRRGRR